MAYLVDTNVLSELRKADRCNPNVAEWYQSIEPDTLFTSVLVMGEIWRGIERMRQRDPRGATALEVWWKTLNATFQKRLVSIDKETAVLWGGMSINQPLPSIDALLAASAIRHGMILVTRNIKDMDRSGASLLNPFQPCE